MRKIKEILRLRWSCNMSQRRIAQSCGCSRGVVNETLRRATAVRLQWPLPEPITDAKLEQLLYPSAVGMETEQRPLPVWSAIHQELKGKGVTLCLLWQEYKAQHPDNGLQYSRFCDLYRAWRGKLSLSMRQTHVAGEKMFVDYAGPTIAVIDKNSGEILSAQVFVAVLGASSYTFAEATWSQSIEDWISSHIHAFTFFGGVPEIVVPDNLKSGVIKPCRYDPDLNPSYHEMANHYGVAVIPARVRKPKDKSKAEGGVLLVERWIMAALRKREFFDLSEVNQAIGEMLTKLNSRPFQKLPGSRRSQFETLDQPALRPLPEHPYEYADWLKKSVGFNYHIEVNERHYSVPYQLYKKHIDVRVSGRTVEFFLKGKRVAVHIRKDGHGYITLAEHMPEAHRQQAAWTPERIIKWSREAGEYTAKVADAIMCSKRHPQQGFKACMGLMSLGKKNGNHRLEAACLRATLTGCASYKSIKSILKMNLDSQPIPEVNTTSETPEHDNIRGPEYFR